MNPIINPWVIYLITRLDSIKALCDVVMALTIIITILCLITFHCIREGTDSCYQTNYVKMQRDVQCNGERLRNMFDTYAFDLDAVMENKDDKTKLKKLTEIADTCCGVLKQIHKEEVYLNEKIDREYARGKFYRNAAIATFSIFCLSLLGKTLIPNTEVGYQILAASYITPDNIDLAKNTSKEAIEWIIQTIITSIQNMR